MTVQLLGTPGVDVPKHSRSAAPGARTGWIVQSAGATRRLWALAHPCLSLRGGQSGKLPRSPSLREPSLLWEPPSRPCFSLHHPGTDPPASQPPDLRLGRGDGDAASSGPGAATPALGAVRRQPPRGVSWATGRSGRTGQGGFRSGFPRRPPQGNSRPGFSISVGHLWASP